MTSPAPAPLLCRARSVCLTGMAQPGRGPLQRPSSCGNFLQDPGKYWKSHSSNTPAYVSIRQHTSAYVRIRKYWKRQQHACCIENTGMRAEVECQGERLRRSSACQFVKHACQYLYFCTSKASKLYFCTSKASSTFVLAKQVNFAGPLRPPGAGGIKAKHCFVRFLDETPHDSPEDKSIHRARTCPACAASTAGKMLQTFAYVGIRQHTSAHVSIAYASIRQHTSAYVSIRQHTCSASRSEHSRKDVAYVSICQHTSAYVSIRQHTSAYLLGVAQRTQQERCRA
jgi:hypothetical protein